MSEIAGRSSPPETIVGLGQDEVGKRALLLVAFFGLLFYSLSRMPQFQPLFHVGFSANWPTMIGLPVLLTLTIGSAFVFARFSFGYLAGFYLFVMMSGYFWLNAFSVLTYDHEAALFSAAASITLFLIPALFTRREPIPLHLPERVFNRIPEAVLVLAVVVLLASALSGFRFVGLEGMVKYRNDFIRPRLLEYAIGNINGALIPFAFACCVARKRWLLMGALCAVASLYYPVTLTKVALFTAPFLLFITLISSLFEEGNSAILSLLIPMAIGVSMVFGHDLVDVSAQNLTVFGVLNFRMLAIPSISLDHYFEFFSSHPTTGFCQISFLKAFLTCPYSNQLGVVMADHYHLGNMNASLFATEGVASVGLSYAPLAAFACGFAFLFANVATASLQPRFILISGAIVPHILLNVPLSTTLLSNGLSLLILLWIVTPRDRSNVGNADTRNAKP